MQKTLQNIATIHTGIFAPTVQEGKIVYLQAKHFDENGVLEKELYPDLLSTETTKKHLLQPGDVLFAAKGNKNFAAVYESHNPPAVASTTFFVIRLTNKNILSQYIAWILNNPSTQTFLKQNAIGTSIASISKIVLQELEITIPSTEIQKTILNIASLRIKQKSLTQQIESLREQQIQQQIINALK